MYISPLITTISLCLLVLLGFKILFFVTFSIIHHRKNQKQKVSNPPFQNYCPLVSIIVPCYNEAVTLENCVKGLLNQSYKNIEILIVNDGSTDNTEEVAKNLSLMDDRIKLFNKTNGGKAGALNYGIDKSRGSVIVSMDADSIFLENTVERLVYSFTDDRIGGVSGNVKVGNRKSFIGRQQAIEYITGLNLQRRTFAQLGCPQVISGAIGAFRREALIEIGGYSEDTIVEDMDITISLIKAGYSVEFNGDAIAYTEAPESIRSFYKQRLRWTFGGFQVLKKHSNMLFNHKYGTMGMIGLPYFLLFPWMDVIISILFILAIINAIVMQSFIALLIFFAGMAIIQGILLYLALSMDKESKAFLLLSGWDSLWYNHLIGFITLAAGIKFLFRKNISWNKLDRIGIELPVSQRVVVE
jgi:peptidoglycan-N-acetylglucosamine deacetylase